MKVTVHALITVLCLTGWSAQSAEVGKEGLLIDLAPHYTTRFDRPNFKGIGKELPSMNPVIDGLRFNLTGQLTLWSDAWAGRGKTHPVSVRDLAVNAKFDELHLVHHGNWHEVDGRIVAIARLMYADGTRHDFPIKWGYHVRSWMYLPTDEELPLGGDPNAKYIWLDPARNNTRFSAWHMLWKTHFMNPHPDRLVRSIEFHSGRQLGPYCVVSAVVAKSDPSRPKFKSIDLGIPPRDFKGRVKITLKSAETGLPITNGIIQTSARTKGYHLVGKCLEPNENGRAVFRYWKEETTMVVIHAMVPGYEHNSRTLDGDIASSVMLELSKSASVGGTVVDEEGKPMAGVTVKIPRSISVTDQDGRWLLDRVPATGLRYPITMVRYGESARQVRVGQDMSSEDLFAKKAKLVFTAGCELTGIIRDEKGKPAPNARVFFGNPYYDKTSPEIRSDKDGRFKFTGLPPGRNYLTIRKWEQAPEIIRVYLKSKNQPMEINLKPGHATMIFVKDANGKPIPEVTVTGYPTTEPRTYRVQQNTKSDGSVFFGGLPKEPMSFSFEKKDLRRLRRNFAPSMTKPYEVVLGGERVIDGRVVDDETGKPLDSFSVIAGQSISGNSYFYPPAQHFKNGSFKISLDKIRANTDAAIQIEAIGYYPHHSKPFSPDAPPKELVVRMKKGKSLEGRVISPVGKPANNAQITARIGDRRISLRNGELYYSFQRGLQPQIARTDAKGWFKLNPEHALADILVSHKSGFAQIPVAEFDKGQPIRLEAWGSFHGNVTYAGKPVANEIVALDFDGAGFAAIHLQMPTNPLRADANGLVELHTLPPGDYHFIQHVPAERNGSYNYGHSIPVNIEPGRTATVTLDLEIKFRDVAGRVAVQGLENVDLSKIDITLRSTVMMKPPAGTMIPGSKAFDELQAERGFIIPEFKLRPRADGSFTLKDVPIGYYRVHGRLPDESNPKGRPLGRLYKDISIKHGSGPVDLGQFILLPYVAPNSVPKL